jgi:serine/threonine protein kinase
MYFCRSDFLEEVRLLASLNDPNIVELLGICTDEEPFAVVMESWGDGDLCEFLRAKDPRLLKQRSDFGLVDLLFTLMVYNYFYLRNLI